MLTQKGSIDSASMRNDLDAASAHTGESSFSNGGTSQP
jgi:hypothetical protein